MAPVRPKQATPPPEFTSKYQQVIDALSQPVSSYTLLYEPHLIPEICGKKKKGNTKPESTHKNRLKKKTTKEKHPFPTDARALTGTGMLDGVAVRYVHKRKKIELGGIIKGSTYLCGCASCNFSETVTADEFEHHAGCQTSHANNHIHFENGKSMHMVVKELANTPRSMLCDAIQTVTGCPLNQEAFSTWKELYLASQQ